MSRRKQARPRHLDDEVDLGSSAVETDNGKKIYFIIFKILKYLFKV